MKTKIALSLMLLWFAGCQQKSDVDKCVDAHIKAFATLDHKDDERTKTAREREFNLVCLRAQAGKE